MIAADGGQHRVRIIGIDTPETRHLEKIEAQCRFSNCRHDREPGCAVQRAMEEGLLERARVKNYCKI